MAATNGRRDEKVVAVEQGKNTTQLDVEKIRASINGAESITPRIIKALNIRELLDLELAPREFILEPILLQRQSAMIHSWRGVGKTHFGLGMAYAVAAGGEFLGFKAPKARKVLYVDGEMTGEGLQERLAEIVKRSNREPPDASYFQVVTPNAQKDELLIPNLDTPEGQTLLGPLIEPAEVIFFDSLATLFRRTNQNDTDSWLPIQDWLLSLRRKGKAVVLFQHDGKGGTQRGTSAHEDILDLIIQLKNPPDYEMDQGARFQVLFKKTRSYLSKDAKPFLATLNPAGWKTEEFEELLYLQAAELFDAKCSVRDVAEQLEVSKTKAGKWRLKWSAGSGRTVN
jgi:putative DNA primase/helicase